MLCLQTATNKHTDPTFKVTFNNCSVFITDGSCFLHRVHQETLEGVNSDQKDLDSIFMVRTKRAHLYMVASSATNEKHGLLAGSLVLLSFVAVFTLCIWYIEHM